MEHNDWGNSSDIEMPEPAPNPHAHQGGQSIEAMIQSAFSDWKESKLRTKMLTQSDGAPGTQIARSTWINRFEHFRLHTLRKQPDTMPTAEDIERFFFSIPKSIHGKSRDPVSWTYLTSGFGHLIYALKFRHNGFILDARDGARFKSVLSELRDEGLITKDPVREKMWIVCTLVKKLVVALLSDALDYGTHSWDVTCSKSLSLILQAALSSRAGDIARSKHYKGVEYLQWGHICLKRTTSQDGSKHWVALITLMYQKGRKDDKSRNTVYKLEAIDAPDNFVVCPVKWLLIMALRTSAVTETTIEDLEMRVDRSHNKTIVWSTPDRPVLCAFRQKGCMLDLQQPATEIQILQTLRSAADLIGMKARPVSPDVRRGAAADLAHLSKSLTGTSTVDAGRMLGHAANATERGLTASYVGPVRVDAWKRRLDNGFDDDFSPDLATTGFKRAHQSAKRVKEICNDEGLDLNDPTQRDKARHIGREALRNEWLDASRSLETNAPGHHFSTPTPADVDENAQQTTQSPISSDDQDESLVEEQIPIDPQLLALSGMRRDGPDGLADAVQSLDSVLTDSATNEVLDSEHFPMNDVNFIEKFSKRNDCRNEVAGDVAPAGAVSGGSRDPPSRWQYSCVNAPACNKTFNTRHLRDSHAKNCDPSPKVTRTFACTEDECRSSFDTQTALNTHVQYVLGSWVPRACEEEGCLETEVFQVRGAYMMHRQNFHSAWSPQACPLCPESAIFTKRNAFTAHLSKVHPNEKAEYMPRKTNTRKRASLPETLNWRASTCLYPGCPSDYVFDTRGKYTQHLRIMHKVYAADSKAYMPGQEQNE